MAIARNPTFALDAPDASALATFYGALLDWTVETSDGWSEIRDPETGQCICFQQVKDYTPPQWPGQDVPQQVHLDVVVDSFDESEPAVLALGATKPDHQPGETFRVYLDPAGHPFCLCLS